jgi:alanyl aminopeptidase
VTASAFVRFVLGLCFVFGSACTPKGAAAPPLLGANASASPVATVLRLPRDVRPLAYALELSVLPKQARFSGRTQIVIALDAAKDVIALHGKELHVTSVSAIAGDETINGSYQQQNEDGLASLHFERPLPAGQSRLVIAYDAPFDRSLQGLYRVDAEGESYAFTQFESISARKAFPCFDEPGWKTPFDLWLTVDAHDVAVSNTLPIAEEHAGARKRVHFAQTQPLPTYLVALGVGPLDVVDVPELAPSTWRSRPVPMRGIAAKGHGPQLAHALASLAPTLNALESYFGIAYPYEKLDVMAVPDFAAGAMENAGLVTFRDALLLIDPEHGTESQRRSSAFVLAHELAHQWFGDLVTMDFWDDIWLNEAFATWLEYRTVNQLHPEYEPGIEFAHDVQEAMESDSRVTARMIRQPIRDDHDIMNAFDSITYSKGGGVIAMFERWVGASVFQQGIQAYLRKHAFANARSEDLLAALSESAGKDVATPFTSFLTQAGVPQVDAKLSCSAGMHPQLQLHQSRYLPLGSAGDTEQRWQIPVCARYQTSLGVRETCTLLVESSANVMLDGETCPSWIMPNADGAGYYRFSLPPAELDALRTRGLPSLTTRERYVLLRGLIAGFEAGTVSGGDVLDSLPAFATDSERAVATGPIQYLAFLRNQWLGRAGLPPVRRDTLRLQFERYVSRLYAPLADKLGFVEQKGETGETKLLRGQVLGALCDLAGDKLLRARLAQAGNQYLGLDSDRKLHPNALPNELLDLGVRMLVEEGDDGVFDAVFAAFKSTSDANLRGRFLRALSSVRDERSPRALLLSLDPALRVNEVTLPLRVQLADYRTRAAAYAWFELHFDALKERLSAQAMGGTPWFAAGFCDQSMAVRVHAFFDTRAAALPGAPRSLGGALETLGLCEAVIKAQSESIDAFFAR